MSERSKLVSLTVRNLGCIGPEGIEVALDDIVCLVGRNNAGKSTILRAYELAQGGKPLTSDDRCHWTPQDQFPEVELVVHIPDGIPNIDQKWKISDGSKKLVRSRWQWTDGLNKPTRQTWDPQIAGWAEDGKAGGADNVFNSRLPQPIRIDSLQDAHQEHDDLIKIVTDPVAVELKALQNDPTSKLHNAIQQVVTEAMGPVDSFQKDINRVAEKVDKGFKGVFPELGISIRVTMDAPNIDAARSLQAASRIQIMEGDLATGLKQQGTGSRRALFWSLLQVRNSIVQERRLEEEQKKGKLKLEKELSKAKSKEKSKQDADKIQELEAQIKAIDDGILTDDVALPGYILLIDEPENALHPMAIRKARNHLYALAEDPNWQVMLSTHSPYFIDPLVDHTTIVRLERVGKTSTPSTFRTATAKFTEADKENLRALIQLDSGMTEIFFGSYPIIVEGDTELASFISSVTEDEDVLGPQVILIPARGKATIVSLIKLLDHFRVPFGVLHDADSPRRTDGAKNSAWTVNANIIAAIQGARTRIPSVRHRINMPDIERFLGGLEETKDKPILAYRRIKKDTELKSKVRQLFYDLFNSSELYPFSSLSNSSKSEDIMSTLEAETKKWAKNNAKNDVRFNFEGDV